MSHRALAFAVAIFAATACSAIPEAQDTPRLTPPDLAVLTGSGWTGTLTYRDYSPPFGEVTIQAALDVRETPEGLTFAYTYPKEPQANSQSPFPLAADGTVLDGATVTGVSRTPEAISITTSAPCEDAGEPATCTYDYAIAAKAFTIRKTVQAGGTAAPFTRNTYRFTRP